MTDAGVTAAAGEYDAFLSFSSQDLRVAQRVQRFLERYRHGGRKVRVFLDRTDLRGGRLVPAIRAALRSSRALIVLCSPAAADSRWVQQEARDYLGARTDARVAAVLAAGEPADTLPRALRRAEVRYHDVRSGWWLGLLRRPATHELLRLLAFLTDVPLRDLISWQRRRRLASIALVVAAAVLPLAALLWLWPVATWERVVLDRKHGAARVAVHPVAAEVQDRKLWLATRHRGMGPQGFRNYFEVAPDAIDRPDEHRIEDEFAVHRHLLPAQVVSPALRDAIAAALTENTPLLRPRHGQPFVGEVREGHCVKVQPLGLTEDEQQDARDHSTDTGEPVPESLGALVVTNDGHRQRAAIVDGLVAYWPREWRGDPPSPAQGPSVAWLGQDLWLGLTGWDRETDGGLWHSSDAGASWQRVERFFGVSSIAVRSGADGRPSRLVVAESFFERWQGGLLVPYPARVVERTLDGGEWTKADVPPFGTRSELELCGEIDGAFVVRVDHQVFREHRGTLWSLLFPRRF